MRTEEEIRKMIKRCEAEIARFETKDGIPASLEEMHDASIILALYWVLTDKEVGLCSNLRPTT